MKLKYLPKDFRVIENCMISLDSTVEAEGVNYYSLTKSGYTTFEALERVADFFQIPQESIQYAGLKDEDAVTSQFLSMDFPLCRSFTDEFNQKYNLSEDSFMRLAFSGAGTRHLRIGGLNGNGFRVILRDLTLSYVDALRELGRRSIMYFQNFYGLQRFGVPDGPKVTHLVGEQLINGNFVEAFNILRRSGSNEGKRALVYGNDPKDFFQELDQRTVAFYKNAHSSYLWNSEMNEVSRRVGEYVLKEYGSDIVCAFLVQRDDVASLIKNCSELPYTKFGFRDGRIQEYQAVRPTVIQTRLQVGQIKADPYHEGRYECELDFFLPSGCYATVLKEHIHAILQSQCGS